MSILRALQANQFRDWIQQAMAWSYAQTDSLRRASAAKGLGLDPVTFSRPFPGSPTTIVTNTETAAQPAAPVAAVAPTTPAAPAALGWLGKTAIGTALALGTGGAGLGLASFLKPAPQPPPVTAPAQTPPALPPSTPAAGPFPTPDKWQLKIVP
jgi:hypothetical protein